MSEQTIFPEKDIPLTKPAETVGIAATVNDRGEPHISLLTSLQTVTPSIITAGEFCKGISKENMEKNRKTGFLIMTLDRKFWTGTALWYEKKSKGEVYEEYNRLPMFRYNSYFGINTVHFLKLRSVTSGSKLPMGRIIFSVLRTKALSVFTGSKQNIRILNPFSKKLINGMGSLNFLSFLDNEGYPRVVPVIQAVSVRSNALVFTASPFSRELEGLKEGSSAAMLSMNLKMESVLVRGTFSGFRPTPFGRRGRIELNWVYNSMPPVHRQIWPETELEAVREF